MLGRGRPAFVPGAGPRTNARHHSARPLWVAIPPRREAKRRATRGTIQE